MRTPIPSKSLLLLDDEFCSTIALPSQCSILTDRLALFFFFGLDTTNRHEYTLSDSIGVFLLMVPALSLFIHGCHTRLVFFASVDGNSADN